MMRMFQQKQSEITLSATGALKNIVMWCGISFSGNMRIQTGLKLFFFKTLNVGCGRCYRNVFGKERRETPYQISIQIEMNYAALGKALHVFQ